MRRCRPWRTRRGLQPPPGAACDAGVFHEYARALFRAPADRGRTRSHRRAARRTRPGSRCHGRRVELVRHAHIPLVVVAAPWPPREEHEPGWVRGHRDVSVEVEAEDVEGAGLRYGRHRRDCPRPDRSWHGPGMARMGTRFPLRAPLRSRSSGVHPGVAEIAVAFRCGGPVAASGWWGWPARCRWSRGPHPALAGGWGARAGSAARRVRAALRRCARSPRRVTPPVGAVIDRRPLAPPAGRHSPCDRTGRSETFRVPRVMSA
jgi:hypothetical protein